MSLKRISKLRRTVYGFLLYKVETNPRVEGNSEQAAVETVEELADSESYMKWGWFYEKTGSKRKWWRLAIVLNRLTYYVLRKIYPNAPLKATVEKER